MAATQPAPWAQPQVTGAKHEQLPDEPMNVLSRSLKVGAGAGACGILFGTTAGIVKGTTPVLFALTSGLQWFGLGSVYYGTRYAALARYGPVNQATSSQRIEASAIGGAVSGATVGGIFRGPRNVLPAALIFSLLGAGGQFAINKRASSDDAAPRQKDDSWLNFKWSPMKKLTDAEYEHILSEKLLELEAEIAIVDDNIAELKAQKEQQKASLANQPSRGESSKS